MSEAKLEEVRKKVAEAVPDVEILYEIIGKYITVKPKGFIGSENFSKIQAVIREFNGEYVSAGRLSHFRIALEPEENSLREWYAQQKPLHGTVNFTVNCQASNPQELENMLNILKKHIQRENQDVEET